MAKKRDPKDILAHMTRPVYKLRALAELFRAGDIGKSVQFQNEERLICTTSCQIERMR